MLERHRELPLRAYVVWEPVLLTDWRQPGAGVRQRLSDRRAMQYWDRPLLLSAALSPVLRANADAVVGAKHLATGRIVWDLAAVYRPGVQWSGAPPVPAFAGAPVLHTIDALEQALIRASDRHATAARAFPASCSDLEQNLRIGFFPAL
ncbi:MAG: hypothetical protein HYZ57_01640 [Acidobacteria bacterium]|nr:hypothetical protein [Acidobacteriota bacterium]MBI3278526.1 hypothetical protein [Acidobacteriota bacterium]